MERPFDEILHAYGDERFLMKISVYNNENKTRIVIFSKDVAYGAECQTHRKLMADLKLGERL